MRDDAARSALRLPTLARAASNQQDPLWTQMHAHDDAASGGVRDNERDPRLPWNAGKTGIMVAVMVTSVTCDGGGDAAASCAERAAMCAEMAN